MPGVGFDGQNSPDGSRAFLDGNRTKPQAVKLVSCESPGKTESFAFIVHYQSKPAVVLRQFYHDMGSLRMLFYIVECFSVNLENLAADAVRSVQFHRIYQYIQR